MSSVSMPSFDNHPDPQFKREGTFRFFDLPAEVREQILRLLLVRGNVALGKETSIRNRFSGWDHERPMWQLLKVNGQLRAEARAVLYSQRNNTFYFTIGSRPNSTTWLDIIGGNEFPHAIKKLDCAFDMRDFEDTAFNMFEDTKSLYDDERDPGDVPFEQLSQTERMEILHDCYRSSVLSIWDGIAATFCMMRLYLLRLDISKARCPLGCCRLAEEAVGLLEDFRRKKWPFPERIEILGVLDHEKESLFTFREDHDNSEYYYYFVDTPGCTCDADNPDES